MAARNLNQFCEKLFGRKCIWFSDLLFVYLFLWFFPFSMRLFLIFFMFRISLAVLVPTVIQLKLSSIPVEFPLLQLFVSRFIRKTNKYDFYEISWCCQQSECYLRSDGQLSEKELQKSQSNHLYVPIFRLKDGGGYWVGMWTSWWNHKRVEKS